MALILNSTIFDSAILHKTLTQTNSIWLKLIHSDSTWGWWPSWILPSWILPSWIQPFCTKLWLKLIQSDSNSFILTQLDDGSHFEFCHLSFPSQTHSNWQRLVPTFCTKKNLHSFIPTQLDDGSHLEFYHVGFRHCHVGFRHLLIFCQIYSKNALTPLWLLTQTNSIWLKIIHSHSTWWWLPSWILPSWIQPFCTKLWLKLIQSNSNSFILTQLDDGSHLEFSHLEFCHLGFSHFALNSDSN